MIVGCYDMHLYCDGGGDAYGANCPNDSAAPAEFQGRTEAECKRKARKLGWRFTRDHKAYCAGCSK